MRIPILFALLLSACGIEVAARSVFVHFMVCYSVLNQTFPLKLHLGPQCAELLSVRLGK